LEIETGRETDQIVPKIPKKPRIHRKTRTRKGAFKPLEARSGQNLLNICFIVPPSEKARLGKIVKKFKKNLYKIGNGVRLYGYFCCVAIK